MKQIFAIVLVLVLSLLTACGGKGNSANSNTPGTSQSGNDNGGTDENKVPSTPSEFLAQFGLTEADVMPEGATGGTLTLNPNNSYIGEIEYTIENAHPANGLDKTIKTALYEKVMEKCRTLATDGKIYNNVSSKKEYVWNGTSDGMVFQYLYNSGYVTFSIGSYGKKFTVSPQFDQ